MNCIFCNSETTPSSEQGELIYHHCNNCSPIAYFVSHKNTNKLAYFFFYSTDNKVGNAYRIRIMLEENKTVLQWVNQEEVSGIGWLIQDEKTVLTFNRIIDVTPSNFYSKLKTWLTFS